MHRFSYIIIIFLLILGDITLFTQSSDIRIFTLLIIYWLLIKTIKLNSRTTFIFSLIFLILAYFQFILSDIRYFDNPGPNIPFSEKAAVWAFLFMVVGIIQKWRE